jgi:hypothetical protein
MRQHRTSRKSSVPLLTTYDQADPALPNMSANERALADQSSQPHDYHIRKEGAH